MAEIALNFLLQKLSALCAEEEVKLHGGIEREVMELKYELESMIAMLQDADARGGIVDERVKRWVQRVRDVVYDTEDVLDEFFVRFARPQKQKQKQKQKQQGRIINSLANKLGDMKHLKTRHTLATKLQGLKKDIRHLSEILKNYGCTTGTGEEGSSTADTRDAAPLVFFDEADLVGIDEPKDLLIRWLTEGEEDQSNQLKMISVVGMGGLGKTTLVMKVYDSQIVKRHFDCHAWVTVSKSYVIRELLQTAITGVLESTKELAPPQMMGQMKEDELIQMLKSYLRRKRYVIVFDDVWDINVWEAMKFAFPDCDCGSRIMFTTRMGDVATSIKNNNHIYTLQPLSYHNAWFLFCMKAFHMGNCPEELEELSLSILEKCSGLPLAIVTIGGLLSTKDKTLSEWRKVLDNLSGDYDHRRSDYDLRSLCLTLLLSYRNLPSFLKPCYLSLSIFPEDHFIQRKKLIRLWVAEGFIQEKEGHTMEEVAEDYVDELLDMNMIQVAERNQSYGVKSFRIHYLMRKFIEYISREQCFSATVGSQGMHGMARHLAIHNNSYDFSLDTSSTHIRTLVMFTLDESNNPFPSTYFQPFRFLRVLDLEGAHLVEFPPHLVELIHLRYLCLRSKQIDLIPKSVGKLKYMETLDLKGTCISVLPVEILMLQRLRHLLVYHHDYDFHNLSVDTYGMCVPKGIRNLTCLQELSIVDVHHNNNYILKDLGNLTQLRKLGISNLRRKDGLDLCVALEKMKHLNSLRIISSADNDEFLQLGRLSSPPELLLRLYLVGPLMALPYWIASLRNLVCLVLQESCLDVDPLKAFQYMPSLMFLELGLAYKGRELCCEVGGYPKLKKLRLYMLEHLRRVRFMERSMPALRRLTIENCPTLKMVPQGIEKLMDLQELVIGKMLPGFVDRVRRPQGEDCWKVKHIPTIKHAYEIQGIWDVENLR